MRNPLNISILGLNLLEEQLSQTATFGDKQVLFGMASDVKNSIMTAVEILNDLILYNKLESNDLSMNMIDSTPNKIIKEVAESFEPCLKYADVRFHINLSESLDQVYIKADDYKISKVLRNLLSNAVKFTPSGGHVTIGAELIQKDALNSDDNIVNCSEPSSKSQKISFVKETNIIETTSSSSRKRGIHRNEKESTPSYHKCDVLHHTASSPSGWVMTDSTAFCSPIPTNATNAKIVSTDSSRSGSTNHETESSLNAKIIKRIKSASKLFRPASVPVALTSSSAEIDPKAAAAAAVSSSTGTGTGTGLLTSLLTLKRSLKSNKNSSSLVVEDISQSASSSANSSTASLPMLAVDTDMTISGGVISQSPVFYSKKSSLLHSWPWSPTTPTAPAALVDERKVEFDDLVNTARSEITLSAAAASVCDDDDERDEVGTGGNYYSSCRGSPRLEKQHKQKSAGDSEHTSQRASEYSDSSKTLSFVRIYVQDTGVGISKDAQAELFEEFGRCRSCISDKAGVSATDTRNHDRLFGHFQPSRGSGLGLWVARSIVEAHNGTIGVYSEGENIGKGSKFYIDLPVSYLHSSVASASDPLTHTVTSKKSVGEHESTSMKSPPSSSSSSNKRVMTNSTGLRALHSSDSTPHAAETTTTETIDTTARASGVQSILVVDDSRNNRKMLTKLLQTKNISYVEEAVDGADALAKYKHSISGAEGARPYDVIMMDFVMPVMDGPTATKELRALGYNGLIVGVTGNSLQVDIDHFLKSGVNEVMLKPLDITKFMTYVKREIAYYH